VTVALTGASAVFSAGQITVGGLASQDAGGRIRPVLYIVRVDGKEFASGSLAEALTVLHKAKELAKQHALQIAREATNPDARAVLPRVRLPKITSSAPLRAAVAETRKEIKDIYEGALRDAEIAMWFEIARRNDEDEDVTLLLM